MSTKKKGDEAKTDPNLETEAPPAEKKADEPKPEPAETDEPKPEPATEKKADEPKPKPEPAETERVSRPAPQAPPADTERVSRPAPAPHAPPTTPTSMSGSWVVAAIIAVAAIVALALLGSKACGADDDAKSAKKDAATASDKVDGLGRRVSAVETRVDGLGDDIKSLDMTVRSGFKSIADGLKAPKDPCPPDAMTADPPRRTYTAPKPAAAPKKGSLDDHERRITDLEVWRRDRVDPALDKMNKIAEEVEPLLRDKR